MPPALPTEELRAPREFRVVFGGGTPRAGVTGVEAPVLGGQAEETIFPGLEYVGEKRGISLYGRPGWLVGHACVEVAPESLADLTRDLYAGLLEACRGRHLYRVWNYVPAINIEVDGLENYRAFCMGRSLAFESEFGAAFQQKLPAASAVGCDGHRLHVIFAAGETMPQHIENPEQVPAYQYPPEHGPRSPSFSRATVVAQAERRWVFVSGTAAIKGHASRGKDSLDEQIACTLDNLRLVSVESGVGERLGAGGGWTRHFKIYLRRAADFPKANLLLRGKLLQENDRVTWLRSDVCRAELDIEIEATLVGR